MKGKEQILNDFGKKLKARRKARGITQLALSYQIDSTDAYISKLEHGRAEPGLIMILALEKALGCKPGDLWRE